MKLLDANTAVSVTRDAGFMQDRVYIQAETERVQEQGFRIWLVILLLETERADILLFPE